MISTFYKDHLKKLTVTSPPLNSTLPMAKPMFKPTTKQKCGRPTKKIKRARKDWLYSLPSAHVRQQQQRTHYPTKNGLRQVELSLDYVKTPNYMCKSIVDIMIKDFVSSFLLRLYFFLLQSFFVFLPSPRQQILGLGLGSLYRLDQLHSQIQG